MKHKKFILGGVVLCAAVVALVVLIMSSSVPSMSISELNAEADSYYGEKLSLQGKVLAGSVHHDQQTGQYSLVIFDDDADIQESLYIIYNGTLPHTVNNSDEVGVTVEGKLEQSELAESGYIFHATKLVAKCASKYES